MISRSRALALLVSLLVGLLVSLLSFAVAAAAGAAGGESNRPPASQKRPASYDEGVKLVEAGDLEGARAKFEDAARQRPRDPDVLNMLAYSLRKTGELDRAISTYRKALEIRPQFPQAREYLGEAYLQAALRELETLEGYGKDAESERAKLVQALQSAVWELPAAEPGARSSW